MTQADLPLLTEFEAWRRQADELRFRLEAQRTELMQRLADIERALDALPAPLDAPAPPTFDDAEHLEPLEPDHGQNATAPNATAPNATAPQVIRALLTENSQGLKAAQIIAAVAPRKITADTVHTTLYRMVKAGDILTIGDRGDRIYRLIPDEL